MSNLLSEIEDLKTQLNSEKNRKDNRNEGIIRRLNQQIKALGKSGQATLAGSVAGLNSFQSLVDGYSDLIGETNDYGAETINIGEELKKYLAPLTAHYYILGKKAVSTGDDTVEQADKTRNVQQDAHNQIGNDISSLSRHQSALQQQTGVGAINEAQNSETNKQDGQKDENNETGTVDSKQTASKNDNKSENTAPELDESIKAHSSLDEILRRKLRKGETIES